MKGNNWIEEEFYELQTLVSEKYPNYNERFVELRDKYYVLDHNLAKVIAKGATTVVANANKGGCIFRSQFEYNGIEYTTRIVPNPMHNSGEEEYIGSYSDNDIQLMMELLDKYFPKIQYRLEKKNGYINLRLSEKEEEDPIKIGNK